MRGEYWRIDAERAATQFKSVKAAALPQGTPHHAKNRSPYGNVLYGCDS